MPIPPGYVECHTYLLLGTNLRKAEVVTAWRIDVPPFTQTHADELGSYVDGKLLPFMATDVNTPGGYVLVGQDGGSSRFDFVRDQDGTYSGTAASPQVAVLVKKASGLGGRENRGRMFCPGAPENQLEPGGGLGSTYRGQVQVTVDDLLDDLPNAPANIDQMVILHREGGGLPTIVTQLVVDPLVATQKRRVGR